MLQRFVSILAELSNQVDLVVLASHQSTPTFTMDGYLSRKEKLTKNNPEVNFLVGFVNKGEMTEDEDFKAQWGAHLRFREYKLKNFWMYFKNMCSSQRKYSAGCGTSGKFRYLF